MNTILIIEDEPVISRMYQKIFTYKGYAVETAADGQEGYDKSVAIRPGLILLDFMMPRLSGIEVLEKLKATPETATIPVVMLTNLNNPQEADAALKKGAAKYIIKSEFEPKQVVDLVEEFLPSHTP